MLAASKEASHVELLHRGFERLLQRLRPWKKREKFVDLFDENIRLGMEYTAQPETGDPYICLADIVVKRPKAYRELAGDEASRDRRLAEGES